MVYGVVITRADWISVGGRCIPLIVNLETHKVTKVEGKEFRFPWQALEYAEMLCRVINENQENKSDTESLS